MVARKFGLQIDSIFLMQVGGWMKSKVYKRQVDTRDESLVRIWNAAARTRKGKDQLWRITRDIQTRVVKCTELDGGIFEILLWIRVFYLPTDAQ